jgi:penicillin-binding protein 1A
VPAILRFTLKFLIITLLFVPFFYIISVYRETYDVLQQDFLFRPPLASRIYDRNGELIAELYDEKRQYLPFDRISPSIKEAIIEAEDSNFYTHRGYDVMAMLRALAVDLLSGEVRQGGSTLTQQLAKQL